MNDQPKSPTDAEREIFLESLKYESAEERSSFLDRACANNPAIRLVVETLLKHHKEDEFMQPAGLKSAPLSALEKPGDRIARYKLLQQIGEGGCGVVYMAEQEEPVRRRVALKVTKLGMDTKSVIARFEAERQALALMDHSNIAKVLDAGATDSGRPYFVMELVPGTKITEFCDHNNLTTRQRLELFMQVCSAIQHAHQKGIIHRDIKPSNILVTLHDGVPVPKVIDFGIAKATQGRLTDKTIFTAFQQFIGTPAYMSPEQAEMSGLDIDTRSDVYSLGVLLYELLTGKTPFDSNELLQAGLDAMRRTIREQEPQRPSTKLSTMLAGELTTTASRRQTQPPKLLHAVRGDLDWIVMKALEKDRTRRYETANGLAVDIQRHLNNEPVVARPPSRLYRLQKTVRRNKGPFAAVTALVSMLLIGVGVSTSEAIRATRAEREQTRLRQQAEVNEKKAKTEAERSEQTAQFLKDMLAGVGPSVAVGRDTTMLREILDKTMKRVDENLKDQPEVQLDLRITLIKVYLDLQLYPQMEVTARETLKLARERFGEENLFVADTLRYLGLALMLTREIDEAETVTRQSIAMERKLRGSDSLEESGALDTLVDVLRHKSSLSLAGRNQGNLTEAEKAARDALRIRRKLLGDDSNDVAWALIGLELCLHDEGKFAEAEAALREALEIHLKLYGEDHPYTAKDYQQLAWLISDSMGDSDSRAGEAEGYVRKALEIQTKIGRDDGIIKKNSLTTLGVLLEKQGRLAEAESQYRQVVTIERIHFGTNYLDLPGNIADLAVILRKEGELTEARPLAEEAVALCERHPGQIDRWMVQRSFGTLKDVLTDLGDAAALKNLEDRWSQQEAKVKATAAAGADEAH